MDNFKKIKKYINTDENLIRSSIELDKAISHIVQLLSDSYILYTNDSFSSSVFMSITALEEVSKAHLGSYTNGKQPKGKPRDIFKDHKTKHHLAAMPTVPMGTRLKKAIGEKEIYRIMSMLQSSDMIKLRESSLYFQRENDVLTLPVDKIDKKLSKTLLLFSIEVFDDALVGMTNYSMKIDKKTDAIFEELSKDV